MRWLLVVAIAACGSKDECAVIAQKVRPVIAKMGEDAGRPMSDKQLDEFSKGFCESGKGGKGGKDERAFKDCVLASTSDGATAACLQPLFADYRDATKAAGEKTKARIAELDKEHERLEHQIQDTTAALVDAGAPNAPKPTPKPKVTPIDAAILADWAVPSGVKVHGPMTEIYAVDVDADRLVTRLWDPATALVVPTKGGRLTGKITGKTKAEALAAVAAAANIEIHAVAIKGKGITVDLDFAGAPQRDLFRLLADTLHLNIVVAPGELPDLDVVVKRRPADGLLEAMVALDGRRVNRIGNIAYVIPKDAKLPELAKVKGVIDLDAKAASPAEALAAIRAVAPGVTIGACDGTKFDLRLRRAPVAEAIRAIQVMSGATLIAGGDGGCGIAKATPAELPADGVLAALASSADKKAAVLRAGKTTSIVEPAPGVEVGSGFVTIKDKSLQLYALPTDSIERPVDASGWLASLVRTAAVIHEGKEWSVFLESEQGTISHYRPGDRGYGYFVEQSLHPTISTRGFEVPDANPEKPPTLIPLAKR